MNEKDTISDFTKAIYTATTLPTAELDDLKLTKRENDRFYDFEIKYKNYSVKGIVELDAMSLGPVSLCLNNEAQFPGFVNFNFIKDESGNLLKLIMEENVEDE